MKEGKEAPRPLRPATIAFVAVSTTDARTGHRTHRSRHVPTTAACTACHESRRDCARAMRGHRGFEASHELEARAPQVRASGSPRCDSRGSRADLRRSTGILCRDHAAICVDHRYFQRQSAPKCTREQSQSQTDFRRPVRILGARATPPVGHRVGPRCDGHPGWRGCRQSAPDAPRGRVVDPLEPAHLCNPVPGEDAP